MSASSLAELRTLITLPVTKDEIAFREPWQAQLFALTLEMHDRGLFTWTEWSGYFEAAGAARDDHSHDEGDEDFFDHWEAALERIIEDKGLLSRVQIEERNEELVRNAPAAHQHKARREPVCID